MHFFISRISWNDDVGDFIPVQIAVSADGKSVAAEKLFAQTKDYAETSLLDLLCTTIHVHNFTAGWKSPGMLFLNLHPDVFLDSELTSEFLVNLFEGASPMQSLGDDMPVGLLLQQGVIFS